MNRPSPVPPKRRVVETSACAKGWKRRSICCRCEADAGVQHGQFQLLVCGVDLRAHGDAALGGELDGVAAEIDQHLLQAHVVRAQVRGQRQHRLQFKAQALGTGAGAFERFNILQQRRHVDVGQLQCQALGLDLGHVQDVADDLQQVPAIAHDGVQCFLLADLAACVQQQFGKADDRRQRRADLVAHVGQEGALGLVGGDRFVACGHGFGGACGHHVVELHDQRLKFNVGVKQLAFLGLELLFCMAPRSPLVGQLAFKVKHGGGHGRRQARSWRVATGAGRGLCPTTGIPFFIGSAGTACSAQACLIATSSHQQPATDRRGCRPRKKKAPQAELFCSMADLRRAARRRRCRLREFSCCDGDEPQNPARPGRPSSARCFAVLARQ
jgi:hypothetical protein